MNEDLYFMPILAKALGRPDLRVAVAEAIRRIQAAGGQARHRCGLRQFERFLAEAAVLRQKKAYRRIVEAPSDLERPAGIQFILQRDGIPIETWAIQETPVVRVIGGIAPGMYRLCLDTGRLIWAKSLGPEQLIWTKAFPGMPLRAAADTDPTDRQPSLAESVLEGAVRIDVYPGLEAGLLSVEWSEL